jgi:O-antigen ligase
MESVCPPRAIASAPPALSLFRIAVSAVAITVMLAVNKVGFIGGGLIGNAIFFTILAGMVLKSPEMAIRAFSLCFLGLVSNQAIVLKTPLWTVARFLLPVMCLIRFSLDLAAMRQPFLRPRYLAALLAFVAVAAILSIATQYFVHIALLKLANFAIGSFALFAGIKVIQARRTDMTEWFVAMVVAVALIGLASIPLGIGYNFRAERALARGLFNGPFYHSNTLGPLSAMMAVLMACVVVYGPYRNRWICVLAAACMVLFMTLTRSRTSLGALVVGLTAMVGLSFFLQRKGVIQLPMRISRSMLVALGVTGAVLALAYNVATEGRLTKSFTEFALKDRKAETLTIEDVLVSRQFMIDAMWKNFQQSPWIGIGFEVATSEYFQQNATLLNAPIEKGVLPVAVLEETGIIGAFFFTVFLVCLLGNMALTLNIPGLALILTFLTVNMGEAMFFSLAGHGAYGWLMMAAGIMLGQRCVVVVSNPLLHVRAKLPNRVGVGPWRPSLGP